MLLERVVIPRNGMVYTKNDEYRGSTKEGIRIVHVASLTQRRVHHSQCPARLPYNVFDSHGISIYIYLRIFFNLYNTSLNKNIRLLIKILSRKISENNFLQGG